MWHRSFSDQITLQGLIDPRFYARYRNTGAIWATAEAQLGNRNIRPARELRTLHHKVMLMDVTMPHENDRGIAVAGSYNFSTNAEENNDENLLIFHNHMIANQYYQDFMGAMKRATGEMERPVPHVDAGEWYPVMEVRDGSRFEIEIARRFGYPVRFLGVNTPRVFAGPDSSEFFAAEAAEFLARLAEGKEARVFGPYGNKPDASYGSYIAYVQVRDSEGNITDVNRELLLNGFGEWTRYYRQHPDSISAFQEYTEHARESAKGMWIEPERVGEKISRVALGSDAADVIVSFPININIADESTLQAIVGVGPAIASRIIEYRVEKGGFTDVDELTDVRGIGPATLARMRPYVTVD